MKQNTYADSSEPLDDFAVREYLPESLREDCVIVPKKLLQLVCTNCLILGAGFFSVSLYLLDQTSSLKWVYPVSLLLCWLIARTWIKKVENAFFDRLRSLKEQKDAL